ncbi:caspase family protein [Alsobacter sp. KACC 23698]|uniref:Caspase family protein n=1 Tax=Alsobacter sp. KACC 23698 TaxID=3149229 RepID=A0AAU7JJC9_9HYPH
MKIALTRLLIAALVATAGQSGASAREIRGLLIGVDTYRGFPRLAGSAADAHDLDASLRSIGARDLRVLINAAATRRSIMAALDDLVTRTQAGDTVFLAWSGYGAQEPGHVLGSQPDGMDAVLLLGGFDVKNRVDSGEKLLEREIHGYIRRWEEKGAQVVFIADVCFGEATTRDVDPRSAPMAYRSVSYTARSDDLQPAATQADARTAPVEFRSTTFLAAADKQSKAPEVRIPGVGQRGALSYAVARGIRGAADLDRDGTITGTELLEYARRVTYQLSDQRQRIVAVEAPAAAPFRVITRGNAVGPPKSQGSDRPDPDAKVGAGARTQADPILIASLDGDPERFAGLAIQSAHKVVQPGANPDLVWDPATHDVLSVGDVIARNVDRYDLPSIIERAALLHWLKQRATGSPLAVRIAPDDRLHRKGSRVEVEIDDVASQALVLFNVAGDGTVELLYPIGSDPPIVHDPKHRLQLQVRAPFGADQIVAVSSPRRMSELEQALHQLDRKRSPLKAREALEKTIGADSRVGSAGLFTAP